jgi:CBS domain-containing protein
LIGSDGESACVCDAAGELVGIVSGMDLVFRERRPGLRETLVDLVLSFGQQAARDLERIAATRVGELMTADVVTVEPTTPLDEVAAAMAHHRVSTVPVVEDGRVVGVITRRLMIGSALRRLLG